MTYEYNRKQGGLGGMGALGWTRSWEVPMSREVANNVPCNGGSMICSGASEDHGFLVNQGCRPTVYGPNQLDACRTTGGAAGSLFCCPPGRPGTATTPSTTVAQQPVSRDQIRSLQNFIVQQGCSVGSTGADGVWGPNTQAGLNCVVQRTSWVNVAGRFPWISTLVATPSGQARPAGTVFDPGATAKTPEQAGVSRPSAALPSGVPGEPLPDQVQQASMFGALPWWGWLGLAGGVGLIAVIATAVYKSSEEEEAEIERMELAELGI